MTVFNVPGSYPTIKAAFAAALATPLAGGVAHIVRLAAGTYSEQINSLGSPPGGLVFGPGVDTVSPLIIEGAANFGTIITGEPGATSTGAGTIIANGGTNIWLRNLQVRNYFDASASLLFAQMGGQIHVGENVILSTPGQNGQLVHCENVGSQVQFWKDCTIMNGPSGAGWTANAAFAAIGGSSIIFNGPTTVSMTGPPMPTYAVAFVTVQDGGVFICKAGTSFPGGGCACPKWYNPSGFIDTGGALGANLPGAPGIGPING